MNRKREKHFLYWKEQKYLCLKGEWITQDNNKLPSPRSVKKVQINVLVKMRFP